MVPVNRLPLYGVNSEMSTGYLSGFLHTEF